MIARLRATVAWWALARRQRRNLRRFQNMGPLEHAQIVIRAIERDADLRQRFRQALGVNMKGRPR
jgi:hypothetical protein